ncbi:MAG: bifunctional N(6)-L-threonylcarbamoyladenine synthase/serine/threonine protein kinase [Candidatus Thermoplasmatota archaeon]|nr:bifunctional N(6)-L-threonylcarbamoyladenine synthase/serine/threonine protein kinase [Candidatus Thermoplasmatota archaeon]
MLVLGIESTAHTFGAGVVRDGSIISNVRDMYLPEEGGIHPREAADHHVRVGSDIVHKALEEAAVDDRDLDLVAFSRGPGLGPCLRVGATIARVLSLKNSIPIVGANHCVAHLEIGSLLGAEEPVLLYASGGNTQIIAFVKGRYRVLGETLDIGIGNMLDKLGREMGIPFPAGPRIERLAKGDSDPATKGEEGGGIELLDLPYSVKGMDISFSGIMTAALALRKKGVSVHSICHSVQETCFSMLCEVTERAMAHIGCDEVLLGGGVACNSRLRTMVDIMARERGGRSYAPPPPLAVDNGAMIAFLGQRMFEAGISHTMEETVIDQRFRTDMVDVTWRASREMGMIETPGTASLETGQAASPGTVLGRGAEALITAEDLGGMDVVRKIRLPKGYRLTEIEERIVSTRIRNEARMLAAIRSIGIRTPYVIDVDMHQGSLVMEMLKGPRLAHLLNIMKEEDQRGSLREIGSMIGMLHRNNIVHGDLTTSNFILLEGGENPKLGLIDCSLSEISAEIEKKGVDLRLFFEVFSSTHEGLHGMEDELWSGYYHENPDAEMIRGKLMEITKRGRYMSERWI